MSYFKLKFRIEITPTNVVLYVPGTPKQRGMTTIWIVEDVDDALMLLEDSCADALEPYTNGDVSEEDPYAPSTNMLQISPVYTITCDYHREHGYGIRVKGHNWDVGADLPDSWVSADAMRKAVELINNEYPRNQVTV